MTDPGEHYMLNRKVMVTVINADDDTVDIYEAYADVCATCVPKYGGYHPWPWHDPNLLT